jgi:histidyl-tRNA synthetase
VRLEINTLGDAESRAAYRTALVAYFTKHESKLSEDSRARLAKNPLRILDSKDAGDREIIKGAPDMAECRTPAAKAFFDTVLAGLKAHNIAYTLSAALVRGLDYYNHTVFEFIADDGLGAQNTVLGGGRYDGLVQMMGGPSVPGVGFAAGVERLLALAELNVPAARLVAVVPMGEAAEAAASLLAQELRAQNIAVDMAYKGNAGKRMKRADKIGAAAAVMLGDDELKSGTVTLKNLGTGEQKTLPRAELVAALSTLAGA